MVIAVAHGSAPTVIEARETEVVGMESVAVVSASDAPWVLVVLPLVLVPILSAVMEASAPAHQSAVGNTMRWGVTKHALNLLTPLVWARFVAPNIFGRKEEGMSIAPEEALREVAAEVSTCSKCNLCKDRTRAV